MNQILKISTFFLILKIIETGKKPIASMKYSSNENCFNSIVRMLLGMVVTFC